MMKEIAVVLEQIQAEKRRNWGLRGGHDNREGNKIDEVEEDGPHDVNSNEKAGSGIENIGEGITKESGTFARRWSTDMDQIQRSPYRNIGRLSHS